MRSELFKYGVKRDGYDTTAKEKNRVSSSEVSIVNESIEITLQGIELINPTFRPVVEH
ncbi:hypothetical protein D791_00477 [Nitrincola nitratireducens]|uniref:Uncharacterized protein n=1 Tax=Nitrincola nitratireducens TaxID=1229521 RepID=W9V1B6_9GAMM|nr:hypothetical protein D791_00477 [Nitrincola nitratireducens]